MKSKIKEEDDEFDFWHAQFDIPTYASEDAGELLDIQVWSPRAKVKIREKINNPLFHRDGI